MVKYGDENEPNAQSVFIFSKGKLLQQFVYQRWMYYLFLKGIKKRKFDLYRTLYQIKAKRISVCKPTDTIGQIAFNCRFPNMYLADL